MKLAAVAGANGFLGSAIVNRLVQQGVKVIGIYNSNSDKINEAAEKMTVAEFLASETTPDCIFFTAGNYASPHSQLVQLNHELYQYTLKFPQAKIVFVSSTNVYGIHNDVISESSSFNNPALYALSKLAGEFIATASNSYSILRLTYIYGPGIANNSFIPMIINKARTEGKITLHGDGSRMQDYLYIDDAVSICIAAAEAQTNETYLGATGISVSNKEVAEEIAKHTGCIIEYIAGDSGQSFHFNPKSSLDKLGFYPETSFSEGIKNMLI